MSLPLQRSVQEVGRRAVLACKNAWGAWDEQGRDPGNHKMKIKLCAKGPFKCYVTLFFGKLDPHPPPHNANNIEHYTFVTLFPENMTPPPPPSALRNTWIAPNVTPSLWVCWVGCSPVAYPGGFSGCPETPPPPPRPRIFFKLEGLHPYMHRPSPAT